MVWRERRAYVGGSSAWPLPPPREGLRCRRAPPPPPESWRLRRPRRAVEEEEEEGKGERGISASAAVLLTSEMRPNGGTAGGEIVRVEVTATDIPPAGAFPEARCGWADSGSHRSAGTQAALA